MIDINTLVFKFNDAYTQLVIQKEKKKKKKKGKAMQKNHSKLRSFEGPVLKNNPPPFFSFLVKEHY